jgi:hypothetical protein
LRGVYEIIFNCSSGTAQAERTAKLNKERAANREKIKAQIEAENNKPKPLLMTFEQQ